MPRSLPADPLIDALHLSTGLSQRQVEQQQARYGLNDILGHTPSAWLELVRDTLRDPMLWFLVITSLLFATVGDYLQAGILAVAMLPIMGMDAFLHRRTQISTATLAKRLASTVSVLRDGQIRDVRATDLVPGDVVQLKPNDFVPADSVVVTGHSLQVDESPLTGEAMPIRKSAIREFPTPSADRRIAADHWVSAGTRVLMGIAQVLVVHTGQSTAYGEIVRLARAGSQEHTPLQKAMMSLTKKLLLAALVFCVVLGVTRLIQGYGWVDASISALTLAIAALPEEFPVVFAFFLGIGVYRLAQQQALVRRAVVVENIGRVTCICSDKTGTLTEGRLVLAHQAVADGIDSNTLMQTAVLASRQESQDPLDIALLAVMDKPKADVLATFPFSEDRRRETTLVQLKDQSVLACVKGAPETVLAMCTIAPEQKQNWESKALEFASSGHKVIAFAQRTFASAGWLENQPTIDEPNDGYTFLGLIAFEDPIRAGAKQAVQLAQGAGIRIIMVTGDHAATAAAVARELGLGRLKEPNVVLADELDDRNLQGLDVLARATPAQKLKLVKALKQRGEIVAVTGDGVNDAPALKGSDIGIAMGERGTQAAREVAAIVLLDDNFRTIVRAIAQGRQLFVNLQLSFAYLLMIHVPLVATAAWIPLAGYPLLYLPIHIVLLELIIHPTALLGFQQQADANQLAPVGSGTSAPRFFGWQQWALIALVAIVVTAVMLGVFVQSVNGKADIEHARAVVLATLVASSIAITAGLSRLGTRAACLIVVCVAAIMFVMLQWQLSLRLLQLQPLHGADWLIILITGAVVWALARLFACRSGGTLNRCSDES